MQPPVQNRRSLRIIMALGLFAGALTGSMIYLSQTESTPHPSHLSHLSHGKVKEADSSSHPFFYKSLGAGPASPPETASETADTWTTPTGFAVEISAFSDQSAAEKELDRLKNEGIDAYYTPLSDGGRIIYRVRRGLYHDAHTAETEAQVIAKTTGTKPKVVSLE